MYERFFGLRELPFELTSNPQYLYLAPRHREVLCNLEYGITGRRGMTLLIGEAGTGKTTLVRAALGLLDTEHARYVYLNNPTLTRAEFVEFLAHGFGLSEEARASKTVFLRELERLLLERLTEGVATALLIDEAQSLPHQLLEETRLLANMETATHKLLSVVLAGQPELADRLNEPSLRQLKQRVALRCDLMPLQLHETAAYMAARLQRAGGKSAEIFTREAVAEIHARSRGIPRTISVICDNALIGGFAADRRPVDRDLVLEVCRDLDLLPSDGGTPRHNGNGHRSAGTSPVPASEPRAPETSFVHAPPPEGRHGMVTEVAAADNTSSMFASFKRRRRFSFF
jgi:general secretion pathway protein A